MSRRDINPVLYQHASPGAKEPRIPFVRLSLAPVLAVRLSPKVPRLCFAPDIATPSMYKDPFAYATRCKETEKARK